MKRVLVAVFMVAMLCLIGAWENQPAVTTFVKAIRSSNGYVAADTNLALSIPVFVKDARVIHWHFYSNAATAAESVFMFQGSNNDTGWTTLDSAGSAGFVWTDRAVSGGDLKTTGGRTIVMRSQASAASPVVPSTWKFIRCFGISFSATTGNVDSVFADAYVYQ